MDLEQAQSHEHIFPQLAWLDIHHVHKICNVAEHSIHGDVLPYQNN
jgi:hypothetical protein